MKVLYFILILFLFGCSCNSGFKKIESTTVDTSNVSMVDKEHIVANESEEKQLSEYEIQKIKERQDREERENNKSISNPVPVESVVPVVSVPVSTIPVLITNNTNSHKVKVKINLENNNIPQKILGRLNYVMSDTMEVGVTNTVSVVVSKNMTKQSVVQETPSFRNRRVVDTTVRVTPEMSIKLQEIGTVGNFHIDELTPTIQKIELDDTTLTTWQWRVTPLKDGDKELTITVDLILNGVSKNLNVYDGKIYVHMKNKFWVSIGNFFVIYWQWICSIVLFPLLIWGFKTYILPKFKK